MVSVIVPAAGESQRFPGMFPKWMLPHPTGNIMLFRCLDGIDLSKVDKIYVTIRSDHLSTMTEGAFEFCASEFTKKTGIQVLWLILPKPTISHPETVYETIKHWKIEGGVFLKDVDNQFEYKIEDPINAMLVRDIHKETMIFAANKSYVTVNDHQSITNIVEKRVISNLFCVGGYSFSDVEKSFCHCYENSDNNSNLYISHLVYKDILDNGIIYKVIETSHFVDWNIGKQWDDYCSKFKTIVVPFELLGITLPSIHPYATFSNATKHINLSLASAFKKVYDAGKLKLVVVIDKPEYNVDCVKQIVNAYFPYADIVVDYLPVVAPRNKVEVEELLQSLSEED